MHRFCLEEEKGGGTEVDEPVLQNGLAKQLQVRDGLQLCSDLEA
jgi:hypothetical protein